MDSSVAKSSVFCLATSLLFAGASYAADPFVPDNIPRCSTSINRGAQTALDNHINATKTEIDSNQFRKVMAYQKERENGADPSVINAKMDMDRDTNTYQLRKSAIDKEYELKMFAAKKYKCLLEVFYFIP